MADRNPGVGVAFLVLVLIMPQTACSSKFPRFVLSPRTKQQLQKFFRDHASDMGGLFLNDRSYSDRSQASNGKPRSGDQTQAPATHAGSYVLSFSVGGNNSQPVSGVLDINSDLVWTQCDCPDCGTTTTGQGVQGTVFDPLQSTTMAQEECTGQACQSFVRPTCTDTSDTRCFYTYMYHNAQANSTGYLASDTFTFDSDPVSNVTFGCGFYNVGDFGGASGVIGLGRGPLSLVSQLGDGRFSYYFPQDGDSSGPESFISFGDDATPMTSRAMSTPLLESNADPSSYYVGLTDIQVDGQGLGIPTGTFDLQTDGSGGVIPSITTPVTFLDERAYKLLKEELKTKIGLQTVNGSALGLDLCYTSQSLATAAATSSKIPAMALVFDGNAVMKLETSNYFYMDAVTGLECLSILPSEAGGGSLLGNLIQAGTHMIYDIHGKKLQFESFQEHESPSGLSNQASTPFAAPLRILSLVWFFLVYYMLLK